MNLRNILFGGSDTGGTLTNSGLLLLRVFTGLALALAHGRGKFPPSDKFVKGIEAMGFPAPGIFAWLSSGTELMGGLLLAAGLMTRPVAAFITINMATAAFLAHSSDPFIRKEPALFFGVAAIVFLLCGSGRYGLDSVVRGK